MTVPVENRVCAYRSSREPNADVASPDVQSFLVAHIRGMNAPAHLYQELAARWQRHLRRQPEPATAPGAAPLRTAQREHRHRRAGLSRARKPAAHRGPAQVGLFRAAQADEAGRARAFAPASHTPVCRCEQVRDGVPGVLAHPGRGAARLCHAQRGAVPCRQAVAAGRGGRAAPAERGLALCDGHRRCPAEKRDRAARGRVRMQPDCRRRRGHQRVHRGLESGVARGGRTRRHHRPGVAHLFHAPADHRELG